MDRFLNGTLSEEENELAAICKTFGIKYNEVLARCGDKLDDLRRHRCSEENEDCQVCHNRTATVWIKTLWNIMLDHDRCETFTSTLVNLFLDLYPR